MTRAWRAWTADEDATIRRYAAEEGYYDLARRLPGRSGESVVWRARRLGIFKGRGRRSGAATPADAVADASAERRAPTAFVVRLPRSLHAALVAEAAAEGVSLNALVLAKCALGLGRAATRVLRGDATMTTTTGATRMLSAVVCRVGAAPAVVPVDPSLEGLQAIVGGDLEAVALIPAAGFAVYCNEDGTARGLAPNRAGLLGDFVVLGVDEEGETVGLAPVDAARVVAYLNDPAIAGLRHPTADGDEPIVRVLAGDAEIEAARAEACRAADRRWEIWDRCGRTAGG